MVRFLLHVLGVDDLSGRWYGWWSGAGSDLGELGIVLAIVRRHNCHVRGCWRIGRHPLAETEWLVCRRHAGKQKLTAATARATRES